MMVKLIVISLLYRSLLTMALPRGETFIANRIDNNSTSGKPCPLGSMPDKFGKCIENTDRVLNPIFNIGCKNRNEIRNIHGVCMDRNVVIIFDDDYE